MKTPIIFIVIMINPAWLFHRLPGFQCHFPGACMQPEKPPCRKQKRATGTVAQNTTYNQGETMIDQKA